MRRQLTAGILLLALAMAGCGSKSLTDPSKAPGSDGAASPAAIKADPALANLVPDKVKKGQATIGIDPTYAPAEFLQPNGQSVQGFDVDIMEAISKKLGIKVAFQPAPFDSLLAGVEAEKYDLAISSFTINAERLKAMNMVSYFRAGTRWMVAKGNPKKFDPANPCGFSVSVQTGTTQEMDMLPALQKKCPENKKITILPYQGQDQATTALASGKVDADVADSPVVDYAVQQTGDKLQAVGDILDSAPYGVVVSKKNTDFAKAVQQALTQLKAEGSYDAILTKWGVQSGAITSFEVNPQPQG